MPSWNDLSSAVKAYVIIGAVLLVGLIGFRSCSGGGSAAPGGPTTSTRGR